MFEKATSEIVEPLKSESQIQVEKAHLERALGAKNQRAARPESTEIPAACRVHSLVASSESFTFCTVFGRWAFFEE